MLITDHRRGSGCDYHRTQLPVAHLGHVACKVPTLFVNRDTAWPLQRIRAFKADGGRFVYDQDDSPNLPPSHPLHAAYNRPGVQERLRGLLALADVVTVTSERLAKEFRHNYDFKAPIEVLPNALPYDDGQFTLSADTTSSRPVVWAGGSSHEVDLWLLHRVLDGRTLTLAGYQRVPAWFAMVQMFPGCEVRPVVDVRHYMSQYDGHRIAVAPLAGGPFAECKSNLKILEAGAKGLPIICSRTLPYWTPDMRPFVRFADSPIGWAKHLQALLLSPERCADEGAKLAAYVRANYNLATVNTHRRQILEG